MNKYNKVTSNDEFLKLVKVIVAVVIVFLIFYIITIFVSNNSNNKRNIVTDDSEVKNEIQFEEIIVNQILNQNFDEYYVIVYQDNDYNINLYNTYFSTITSENKEFKYYKVNLDRIFNKSFLSENSNVNVNDIKQIRFKEATLLKINNQKIVDYFEGKEEIVNHLNSIIK